MLWVHTTVGDKRKMNFIEYQKEARKTAIYPNKGKNITYPALGLCGEAGEVAEKIKKIIRDCDGKISVKNRQSIHKELGDVLWYISNLATELDLNLDHIAQTNIEKLKDRKKRGKLKGSGDNR